MVRGTVDKATLVVYVVAIYYNKVMNGLKVACLASNNLMFSAISPVSRFLIAVRAFSVLFALSGYRTAQLDDPPQVEGSPYTRPEAKDTLTAWP